MKRILVCIGLFAILFQVKAADKEPFCLSCQEKQINADVFVVLTNGIWENQIAGQVIRIAGAHDAAIMDLSEVLLFIKGSGAKFVRYGGYAYILYQDGKKLSLVEAVRDEKTDDIVLLKKPMDITVEKGLPFFNVIIPRKNFL